MEQFVLFLQLFDYFPYQVNLKYIEVEAKFKELNEHIQYNSYKPLLKLIVNSLMNSKDVPVRNSNDVHQ